MLGLLSLVIGAAVGLVGACFRITLDWANHLRNVLIAWGHSEGAGALVLLVAACAAATALAAWLVRRYSPHASGSGIPHVEAVLKQEIPPAPLLLIPVKFIGGVLAIGAGLALGREGPSVQMGASVAQAISRIFRRNWPDFRALFAAAAGAGLATAFNAPIAGAIFVLEELVRRFETRTIIAALGASATAISVARLFLGDVPEFTVQPLAYTGPRSGLLFLVLGAGAGLAAVAYNRALLLGVATAGRLERWPVELRAGAVGGAIGLLAWFAPEWAGGGETVTQRTLTEPASVTLLPLVFLLRFVLGAASYAVRTPGGLFAPMLVLGAQVGMLYGLICHSTLLDADTPPVAYAVVGMAAFFTGVVRAPVTGIVLIIEMTDSFPMLLPMLGACFTAMLVPTLLGNEPIYDSLRERPAVVESTPR